MVQKNSGRLLDKNQQWRGVIIECRYACRGNRNLSDQFVSAKENFSYENRLVTRFFATIVFVCSLGNPHACGCFVAFGRAQRFTA